METSTSTEISKNADDLALELDQLPKEIYGSLVDSDKHQVLDIFETVFNHKAFTGRSGLFMGTRA